MNKTKIEYLTHTWNPIAMRCTPVSDGCKNCWHLRLADRLSKNPTISEVSRKSYSSRAIAAFAESAHGPTLNITEMNKPLEMKKPAVIGVQFMGDLFHDMIPFAWIKAILARTCGVNSSSHTFLMLTKRPQRMLDFFNWLSGEPGRSEYGIEWPLKNVWVGVTAENQEQADKRIPILLQIPATVRYVSVEPMIAQVDLRLWLPSEQWDWTYTTDPVRLDWVIVGGESGPGARSMHPEWVRSLLDQCVAGGVPFFMKQMSKKGRIPTNLLIREFPHARWP